MVKPNSKVHGDTPDWPIGLLFADRADVYKSGIHGTTEAGIFGTDKDDGAFSIVINKGYEDDDDQGETIIYTGEGKGKPANGEAAKAGKTQQGPQDMQSSGNAALQRNVATGLPVRVIRGPEGNLKYSPHQGYRYDGLYDVVRAYEEEGKAGFKMCKFELKRAGLGQAPLPLHITGKDPNDKYWSPDGIELLAMDRQRSSRGGSSNANAEQPAQTVSIAERNREITGRRKLPDIGSFRRPVKT